MSKYRSGFEERIAKAFGRRKIDFRYEPMTLDYITPPVPAKNHKYTPDFLFEAEDGHTIYVEAKGRLTVANRQKMLLVKQHNPELDIRFLFMNARQPLISKRKRGTKKNGDIYKSTTYGEWAEKNGFPWAQGNDPATIGRILAEWKKDVDPNL